MSQQLKTIHVKMNLLMSFQLKVSVLCILRAYGLLFGETQPQPPINIYSKS
jgi:hypothetical protein